MPASAWRTPWTVAKPKTPAVAVRWRERRRSRPHPSRRRPNLTLNNPTQPNNPTQHETTQLTARFSSWALRPPIPPLGCLFSFFLSSNPAHHTPLLKILLAACRSPIPPLGGLFSFFLFFSSNPVSRVLLRECTMYVRTRVRATYTEKLKLIHI